jgi:hypothetical protein
MFIVSAGITYIRTTHTTPYSKHYTNFTPESSRHASGKNIKAERNTQNAHRSNTSTVALRVVGGDGKGSLESETVKCDNEPCGT